MSTLDNRIWSLPLCKGSTAPLPERRREGETEGEEEGDGGEGERARLNTGEEMESDRRTMENIYATR